MRAIKFKGARFSSSRQSEQGATTGGSLNREYELLWLSDKTKGQLTFILIWIFVPVVVDLI